MISFKQDANGQVSKQINRKFITSQQSMEEKLMEKAQSLTTGQREVFDAIINTDRNIFLSGLAGTGKSYVTKLAIEYLRCVQKKWVAVCASTAAASRILADEGAVTIHRFFGFKPEVLIDDRGNPIAHATKAIRKADIIICDEASLIRCDTFMSIHASIEKANAQRQKSGLPKIRLILIGDFAQLPPICIDADKKELNEKLGYDIGVGWCFKTQAWEQFNFMNFVLKEIVRQSDHDFIYHLNKIRDGDGGFTNWFNHNCSLGYNKDAVSLYPYNYMVKEENLKRLSQLEDSGNEEVAFTAQLHGNVTPEIVEANGLDYELRLKQHCRILFRANPYIGADWCEMDCRGIKSSEYINYFCNGSTGTLRYVGVDDKGEYLQIELDDSSRFVKIYRKLYPIYEYINVNGKLKKVKSTEDYFYAFPVSLGYALTFHRAQGSSIPSINIYPTKTFASGMLYVGLSRCSGKNGCKDIYLQDFIRYHDAYLDPAVKEFYEKIENANT